LHNSAQHTPSLQPRHAGAYWAFWLPAFAQRFCLLTWVAAELTEQK